MELHATPEFDLRKEANNDFLLNLKDFGKIVSPKLRSYYDKRHVLREVFWASLQHILEVMINFVD